MIPVRGTRDGAGAERERLGTVQGTGHGGNQAPCAGTSSAAGHILAPALASPCWLILLGSRWGSGGAGIPSATFPAPQIFFLRVMFLVLIPFAFSQLSRPVAYHRHR